MTKSYMESNFVHKKIKQMEAQDVAMPRLRGIWRMTKLKGYIEGRNP
jgi:hypothetical protein